MFMLNAADIKVAKIEYTLLLRGSQYRGAWSRKYGGYYCLAPDNIVWNTGPRESSISSIQDPGTEPFVTNGRPDKTIEIRHFYKFS